MKAHADSPRELNELAYALSFDPDSVSMMLDIFAELGLVSLDADDGCKRAGLLPVKGKINLEKSEIYSRLKRKSTGRALTVYPDISDRIYCNIESNLVIKMSVYRLCRGGIRYT